MKIISVNGKPWSPSGLRNAIASKTVQMTIRSGSSSWQTQVSVPTGSLYPKLSRNEKVDSLSEVMKPLVPQGGAPH